MQLCVCVLYPSLFCESEIQFGHNRKGIDYYAMRAGKNSIQYGPVANAVIQSVNAFGIEDINVVNIYFN